MLHYFLNDLRIFIVAIVVLVLIVQSHVNKVFPVNAVCLYSLFIYYANAKEFTINID